MFEQEMQMEKRQSTIVPLLLIVGLIVGIVGVAFYFLAQSRKVLTAAEATPVIQRSVENQPPATVHFRVGTLSTDSSEDPSKPHYRLLEKAGYIKIGKAVKDKIVVSLTPEGQAFLDGIVGVEHVRKDGNDNYTLPLARRQFIQVGKITMQPPGKAVVEYTWKWEPTKAGDLFDAEGSLVKSFGTYERSTLIEKYGANTYHAAPSTTAVLVVQSDKGWEVNTKYY
jgi:hypothetical protein